MSKKMILILFLFALVAGTVSAGRLGVSFTWSVSAEAPTIILFDGVCDACTGEFTSYLWDFGDGTSDVRLDTSHPYASPGRYRVTLSATSNGITDSSSQWVTIEEAPLPELFADFSWTNNGLNVRFEGSCSGSCGEVLSYDWDFGDGSTGTGALVSHRFDSVRQYRVELTVSDGISSDTVTYAVRLVNDVSADFSWYLTGETDTRVQFDGVCTNCTGEVVSYLWDFGDGVSGNTLSPWHDFPGSGRYRVTFSVNSNGFTDSTTDWVSVP